LAVILYNNCLIKVRSQLHISHIFGTLHGWTEGFNVRGTVRSLANDDAVGYLKLLPGADKRLELVEADLLKPGSFDAAVAGCDHVYHTAR
jgi:uncharacterized protein YbjT (DUF2867 family)